jgi:hypothetical protein
MLSLGRHTRKAPAFDLDEDHAAIVHGNWAFGKSQAFGDNAKVRLHRLLPV